MWGKWEEKVQGRGRERGWGTEQRTVSDHWGHCEKPLHCQACMEWGEPGAGLSPRYMISALNMSP